MAAHLPNGHSSAAIRLQYGIAAQRVPFAGHHSGSPHCPPVHAARCGVAAPLLACACHLVWHCCSTTRLRVPPGEVQQLHCSPAHAVWCGVAAPVLPRACRLMWRGISTAHLRMLPGGVQRLHCSPAHAVWCGATALLLTCACRLSETQLC